MKFFKMAKKSMTVVEDFRLYMRIKSNPGPAGVFKFIYAEMLVQKF